jgi:hypothetical protein
MMSKNWAESGAAGVVIAARAVAILTGAMQEDEQQSQWGAVGVFEPICNMSTR